MRSVSITVTDASRNFADCINRARYQGTTFILHKNGVAVARIVPERKSQIKEERELATSEPATEEQQPSRDGSAAGVERARAIW